MADFTDQDLRDSTFRNVYLNGSTFRNVDLSHAVLRDVDLIGVTVTGDIEGLVINEVEITPLVNAELDRRDPERALMRPTDPAGFLAAWDVLERRWDETVARARTLPPDQLHSCVDGEWSFVETLRHLVFATDSWVRRGIQGDPSPWHPLDLPWDQMPDLPGVPRDREARPELDEVLALRRDRQAGVRELLRGLSAETLAADTTPTDAPGWPPPGRSFPVRECLRIVLNEEWEHRRFAERDLAVLLGSA